MANSALNSPDNLQSFDAHPAYEVLKGLVTAVVSLVDAEAPLLYPDAPSRAVCQIEADLVESLRGIDARLRDYDALVAENGGVVVPVLLRRAIAPIRIAVKNRRRRWGWGAFLGAGGEALTQERFDAHQREKRYPLLDAALSLAKGTSDDLPPDLETLVEEAEQTGIRATMTPKEAGQAIPARHKDWYVSAALTAARPWVTSDDHQALMKVLGSLRNQFEGAIVSGNVSPAYRIVPETNVTSATGFSTAQSAPPAGATPEAQSPLATREHYDHELFLPSATKKTKAMARGHQAPKIQTELPDLVTLDQIAASVSRSKRTLERYKTKGLPSPKVKGGGGQAARWDWKLIRPWLESEFGVKLPQKFPASRNR